MAYIDLIPIEGDLLATPAELVCVKHAQSFYGVDSVAMQRLVAAGVGAEHDFEVAAGSTKVFPSGGALAAARVAFFGTVRLGELRYGQLRQLASRMLAEGERCGAARLATTIHGVRSGLDEAEAVLALVGGFVDGFQAGLGNRVAEVLIVERDTARARRMRTTLAQGLASSAGVSALPSGGFRVERSPGFQQAPAMASAGGAVAKAHAFVAMPFAAEFEDIYHYGIAGPVKAAGLLCERVDQAQYDGLIIERIKRSIDAAQVVIADLTLANANVYLEVGYAWGRGRPTLLLAREPSELRFDVAGHRCLMYGGSIKKLETLLTAELARLVPATKS